MAVRGQEHAEPVVGEVAVSVAQASGLLGDPVDSLGAAVADSTGVEVRQDLGPPRAQRPPRRATSGIGQVANEAMTFSAIARPVAGWVAW